MTIPFVVQSVFLFINALWEVVYCFFIVVAYDKIYCKFIECHDNIRGSLFSCIIIITLCLIIEEHVHENGRKAVFL